MAGQEKPPNGEHGGNVAVIERPTSRNEGVSGGGKSLEETLSELVNRAELASLEAEVDKSDAKVKQAIETSEALRSQIADIKNKSREYKFLPPVTRKILARIDSETGTRASTPLLTILIKESLNTDLSKLENLRALTMKIYDLRLKDIHLSKQILSYLMNEMVDKGESQEGVLVKTLRDFIEGKGVGSHTNLSWDNIPTLSDVLSRTGGRMPGFNPDDLSTLPEAMKDLADVIKNLSGREKQVFNIDDPSTWTEDWYEIAMVREYFKTREDKELWASITDAGRFGEYVESKRRGVITAHPGKNEVEIRKLISEEINTDIEWLFSRIYSTLDTTKPDKFFDELEREGYSNSMESAKGIFIRRLKSLGGELEEKYHGKWKDFFYKDRQAKNLRIQESEKEIEYSGDAKSKPEKIRVKRYDVVDDEITPFGIPQACGAKDFINNLLVRVRTIEAGSKYAHDVLAAYNLRSGEKGFWSGLAEFSQKYHTGDMDEFTHLATGGIYWQAHHLIRKYQEAEFARINYNHGPQTFTIRQGEFLNDIQLKVKEDMKKLYRKMGLSEEEIGQIDWKLDRVVNLAWGFARGATLSEPELSAWADPGLDENGHPTHYSIGTNESDPYGPFNPQMLFNRWAHDEHKRQVLLWTVVNFYKKRWDHLEGFKEMEKFFDAWWGGEGVINRANPDERRLYEFFSDMTRIGSLGFRGGWRNKAFEYWIVRRPGVKDSLQYSDKGELIKIEENGKQTPITDNLAGSIDLLESWKALENIGYDAAYLFTEASVISDWNFLKSTKGDKKLGDLYQEKEKLWKYLYEKYIHEDDYPDTTGGSFPEYLQMVRENADLRVKDKVKRKELEKKGAPDHIEAEITRTIIYRGLAGMLFKRVPTKLIKLERNRFSETGERAWNLVRGRVWGDTDDSFARMDKALRHLGMAESLLRQQTSLKMREYLDSQIDESVVEGEKKATLNGFAEATHYEYALTEDFIENNLKDMGISDKERNDAKRVFKEIRNFVLDDKIEKREELHRGKDWHEILGPRVNRFYGYSENFLDAFASKLRKTEVHGTIKEYKDLYFPFEMAPDELDHYFLNWLKAGQGAQTRALREVAEAEMQVFEPLKAWWDALEVVARDPQHNLEPILKPLFTIKKQLTSIHEEIYAHKVMDGLVSATIAYFRKDDLAMVFPFNTTSFGTINSIAAMMYGTSRGIWEWETVDIRNFEIECERMRILPRRPWDFFNAPPDTVQKKFLGIIPHSVATYHPRFKYFSKRLLDRAGGGGKDIAWAWINKYLPLIALAILFQAIRNAIKEQNKGKSN